MVDISVIMAVYNIRDISILQLAVNSILNQSYPHFELVICDDGSTNGTYEALQSMAAKDNRILLLRNTVNRKAGHARNRCIEKASGKFIAIMDADDYSASSRLEEQRTFLLENSEYAFVGSRGQYFFEAIGDMQEEYWYKSAPIAKDFLFTLPFVHASIMFRKETLQKIHGYCESAAVARSEDYDMLMRLYRFGYLGANIPSILYYIRQDEATYRRRKYRYRMNECFVKWRGFKALGLMPAGALYAIKPLLVGLVPIQLLKKIKKRLGRF